MTAPIPDTEIWRKVRADLFGSRPIENDAGKGRIALDMPARAADAAVVPLAVHVAQVPGGAATKKLYVIIDSQSFAIAGIFEFGPGSGGPDRKHG